MSGLEGEGKRRDVRAGDNNACWVSSRREFCNEREECAYAMDDTKEVDVHYFMEILGILPGTSESYSSIKDEKGDFVSMFRH